MPSNKNISRERLDAAPGEVYTKTIQEPTYEFKREHYFLPLIETNKAWTVMLVETGTIDEDVGAQLLDAVIELEEEGAEVLGEYNPNLEYFYSHMEHQLNERIGEDVAGNINIGRTRPEPLARMVGRERLLDILDRVCSLRSTLLDLAQRELNTVMPQWTHYQHAQVSTVAHYLLGIAESLERDTQRLLSAYDTMNECTLGCGALSGTSYNLDRQLITDLLGFEDYKVNTIDCVSGGDHYMEPAAAISNMMVTLSRFCQDMYTWHTWEFDFVEIGDEFSGSSSLMPQKKNPYPFEYVRGRAAYATGYMSSIHETLHNTNFQDIKDVEENTVHPLFDAFDEVERSLELLEGTVASAEFNDERMEELAAEGFASCSELAAKIDRGTDLTYRTAHRIVGDLVGRALDSGLDATEVDADFVNESVAEITDGELDIDDEFVHAALDPEEFVEAHNIHGGPAYRQVRQAIQDLRATLDEDRVDVAGHRDTLANASERLDERVNEIRS